MWVRGATKVYAHLMYGILVIAAEQLGDFLKRLYRTGLGLPPLKKGGWGDFDRRR